MKTIGLLGGMSWESTLAYYQLINQEIRCRYGGLSSAKICLRSVNFQEIVHALHSNRTALINILVREARVIEKGGADCLLICCNTVHKVADEVGSMIDIPLFHIADITGHAIRNDGHRAAGLLGSQFTMRQRFYRMRLDQQCGLQVLVPEVEQRILLHQIISEQLCQGQLREEDRQSCGDIITSLAQRGAEAIILGCTELGLLLSPSDSCLPLYDTAKIHAKYAVDWALQQ